jgi:hypothetical protein
MSRNTKQTSGRIAALASETLLSNSTSQVAKSLAASALAQRHTDKQTGADIEHLAGRVLHSPKYSEETKELAASVLSQTTKDRR